MAIPLDPLFLTPAQINAAQAVVSKFIGTPQAIANGTAIALPHGMGAIPRFFHCYLSCTTAELGYSIGDMVRLDAFDATTSGTVTGTLISALTFTPASSYYGGNVVVDATNITTVVARDGVKVLSRLAPNVGVPTLITNANWRIIMVAYL